MAQQNNAQSDNANLNGKDKKSSEPLFGPNIGPVSSGPAWTMGTEKKVVTDELTPEIVNSWIEKSKEVSCGSLRAASPFVPYFFWLVLFKNGLISCLLALTTYNHSPSSC